MFRKYLPPILILVLLLAGCTAFTSPQPAAKPLSETLPTTSSESTQAANQPLTPVFEASPCPLELPPGAVEGKHIRCGTILVPEVRYGLAAGENSTTIRLAVAVISSIAETPVPDPLVMLVGGPGQSALEAFIPLLAAPGMEGFRTNREIILVEQRGTLHSTPFLQCQEMTQFKLDTMDKLLTPAEEDSLRLKALAACRDRITESGINLAAYNSQENAADVIAVMDALGYNQFNLYGGSYGSLLAQHILRQFPDRIRSAILDAASPLRHEPNMLYKARSTDQSLRLLFSQCEADPKCAQTYPDLESVYFELVDRLNQEPASIQVRNENTGEAYTMLLNGDRLIITTRDLLYLTAFLPDLPQAIYNMRQGDFSLVETIQSLTLTRLNLADGMYHSIVCSELADFTPADFADSSALYPQVADVVEDLINDVMLQPCQVWQVDFLDKSLMRSIENDIPTLLTSGEFDPTVPPQVAQVAVENLTRVYAYTFPGVGHSVLGANACAVSIMTAFIDNPAQEPEAGCILDTSGLTFRYPAGETKLEAFTNEALGLQGLAPSGWTEVQAGVYARLSSATDPTALQIVLDSNASVKEVLADISTGYGLSEPPAPTSLLEVNGLEWSLYEFEVQGTQRDLALAESEYGTLIFLISSGTDEREVIYAEVFLPMLKSLYPMAAKTNQPDEAEQAEITLEPFTDSTMSIQGLVPTGWTNAGPGTFARGRSPQDITVLLMQAAPAQAETLLATLSEQLGLSSPPQRSATRQANGMTWSLYEIEIEGILRDVALAEADGKAYVVILRSTPGEHSLLFETVFLPAVDTLQDIE